MRSNRGQKPGMSASVPSTEPCPSCGAEAPERARFCPFCGSGLDGDGDSTVREHVPLHETPATYGRPSRTGSASRRRSSSSASRSSCSCSPSCSSRRALAVRVDPARCRRAAPRRVHRSRATPARPHVPARSLQARERAASALETWRARSTAAAEAKQVRYSLALLETERQGLLHDLGAAVHGHERRRRGRDPGTARRSSGRRRRGSTSDTTGCSGRRGRGFAGPVCRYRRP